MGTPPKKHHYVPRSILRNFSISGERRNVFVFDKLKGRCFSSPISDVGAERNFYAVEINGKEINFEPLFDHLDSQLARLLSKIVKERSLVPLSADERYNLAVVTACQLLRTKLQRTSAVELGKQLAQQLQDKGIDAVNTEITENQSRYLSLRRILDLEQIANLLSRKDLVLISSDQMKLWTSDNPVVLWNSFPYGDAALAAPGVEIYFPITSDLCLAYLCPSIREILIESFDPHHPRPTPKGTFAQELLKALQEQTPVEYPDDRVLFLNSLQIRNSSRFLFCNEDNFDLARKVIHQEPVLQEVRSFIQIGEIGSPPPSRSNMPHGTWLVLESGYRHHAIQVELLNEGSWAIDFTTSDSVKLAIIEMDAPFACVTVFQDQRPIQMIRNVVFRHIDTPRPFVRVQHADPALNALMEHISREEK